MRPYKLKAVTKHTHVAHNGSKLLVPVAAGYGMTGIPIQSNTKYLGVVISYRNYESLTLRNNIRKVRARHAAEWQKPLIITAVAC